MMLTRIWFYPPLAFARIGPSSTPMCNFKWGPLDNRPRGTGKLTIVPDETLNVDEQGQLTSTMPDELRFKDEEGFRPVCPFFELHGEWEDAGRKKSGPLTPDVLAKCNLALSDLSWRVLVGNYKPYHMTLNGDDKIEADIRISGDQHNTVELTGVSPADAAEPLVPRGRHIPLGWVQVIKPNEVFPELRLRFTPAKGLIYGPSDFEQRLTVPGTPGYVLPEEQTFLNANAAWSRWNPQKRRDYRTNPGMLYAHDGNQTSLGLVDDVCDGVIECSVGDRRAIARIVVGPPDFQPDARPFVSLADGLTDRVKRREVWDPGYMESETSLQETNGEIAEFMQRAYETMATVNLDVQNMRSDLTNQSIARSYGLSSEEGKDKAFVGHEPDGDDSLPLTSFGRRHHRRFVAFEVFMDMLRTEPGIVDQWIRNPQTTDPYYDTKMPALMRGSDSKPMHITQRQYDLLHNWVQRIRRDTSR